MVQYPQARPLLGLIRLYPQSSDYWMLSEEHDILDSLQYGSLKFSHVKSSRALGNKLKFTISAILISTVNQLASHVVGSRDLHLFPHNTICELAPHLIH
jgi:hypothetical protein